MADPRISIIIAGRALCREKNGAYEGLIFQVDTRHKLKLHVKKKFGKESFTGIYDIPDQTKITFMTAGLNNVNPDPPKPSTNLHILNIDALHGLSAGMYVGLKEFPISDPPGAGDPVTTYFNIPQATIRYTNKVSDEVYERWRHRKLAGGVPGAKEYIPPSPGHPEEPLLSVGDEIGIDFTVPAAMALGIKLKFKDVPLGTPDTLLSFPREVGVDYEIRLDNACIDPDTCNIDDFFLYYELIDGSGVEIELIGPRDRYKDAEAPCNPIEGGNPGFDFEKYVLTGRGN